MKEYEEFKVCKDCPVPDVMTCPIAVERQERKEHIHLYKIYKDLRHCNTKNIVTKLIELKFRGIHEGLQEVDCSGEQSADREAQGE